MPAPDSVNAFCETFATHHEQTLLHCPLTTDEAEQITHHTRRITALLAENEALDEHYKASSTPAKP